jgi:ubiquinol-cytochrome c reductase cytochrome b subunit
MPCQRLPLLALCLALFAAAELPGHSQPDSVAAGAALFTSSGCTQCHGPAGEGTAKGPSLRDLRKRLKPEATQKQIHDGGGNMPPFGEALTKDQISSLVDFLQSKNGWKLVTK